MSIEDVRKALESAHKREAIVREARIRDPLDVADAPAASAPEEVGEPLRLEPWEGRARWVLAGRALEVGEPFEVFTNAAVGWLRGRFEWGGDPMERPSVAINVWNPNGLRDEDGLPPWVGELTAQLPPGAICRRR